MDDEIFCNDPDHSEPFACHCKAEGGWLCEYAQKVFDLEAELNRLHLVLRYVVDDVFST